MIFVVSCVATQCSNSSPFEAGSCPIRNREYSASINYSRSRLSVTPSTRVPFSPMAAMQYSHSTGLKLPKNADHVWLRHRAAHLAQRSHYIRSEPLLHSRRDGSQIAVHFTRALAENQRDNALPRAVYVSKSAQDVDFAIGEDDSRLGSILDGELSSPILACDASYSAAQMIAAQILDVLDFERLDVEVVQFQHRDGILDIESLSRRSARTKFRAALRSHQRECTHEVLPLLERARISGMVRGPHLDCAGLNVHSHGNTYQDKYEQKGLGALPCSFR